MDIGVQSQALSLQQLFAAGEWYRVPAFQRSYAWDDAEALELFNDLREAKAISVPHFIGSIVLQRAGGKGPFEIVDGQQRLTTLTIMLCALRDLLAASALRDRVRDALCDDRPGKGPEWRLTLNEFDSPFLRASVQESGASLLGLRDPDGGESRDRLATNTEKLVKAMRDMPPRERQEFAEYILEGCSLVAVHVADAEIAQRVFRALNHRGKSAATHDILKTELFEKANLSLQERNEYARKWSEYESRIRGKGMDELLQNIRNIMERHSGKGSRLLAGFRRNVMGRIEPREFLNEHLPAYVAATEAINDNRIPGLTDADGRINASLRHLATIDHHMWRGPALSFLVERPDDSEGARRFFPLLERLAFMLQLVVPERDHRNKHYGRVLEVINDDRALFDGEGPLAISEDDGERVAERLTGRFTSIAHRRALVLRINAAMPDGEVIPANADVSVEHILPRNLDKDNYWTTVWPNSEIRQQLCETIGNYILLPAATNQKADRLDFRTKKGIYFENGAGGHTYSITRDIIGEDLWSPDVVRRRTVRLANHLLNAWGLQPIR